MTDPSSMEQLSKTLRAELTDPKGEVVNSPANIDDPRGYVSAGRRMTMEEYGNSVTRRLLEADADVALYRAQRDYWRWVASALLIITALAVITLYLLR